jgi:lipopolysaccharide biosynthesis glycosyltransferase
MHYKNKIPIFFAVDDGYIPFLSVSIVGLKKNCSKDNLYLLKVLYNNISDYNIKKIKKQETENIRIEFINVTNHMEKISGKLYTRDYYSKSTYFRLFIADLFPEFNKALYLDSDIAILSDIANLYNIDIGDNLVGAAPDGVIRTTAEFQEYAEKVVGVNDYKNYFNAGILIMNLREMRKCDFQDKFVYLLDTIKFKVAQDQDYLNRICKGRVKIISDSWDKMPFKELQNGEPINLVHYNLSLKPWHYDGILYEEYFWNFAKETEYYDEILSMKKNYTDEEKDKDKEAYEGLVKLAVIEAGCVGDDRNKR